MGKGDKKSRRGKIIIGSYGVRRPKKKRKPSIDKINEVEVAPTTKQPKKGKNEEE